MGRVQVAKLTCTLIEVFIYCKPRDLTVKPPSFVISTNEYSLTINPI